MDATQYSTRSPAVKRLMREAAELKDPTDMIHAQPLEDNLFEWHFTVRGPADTDFAGGVYHGRIILPSDYPMKPPSILMLTPNGRFELNKRICLSISGYHPETWLPSWSIRTALLAIIGFLPTPGLGAVGSLDYTSAERKALARKSEEWSCTVCKTKPIALLNALDEASVENKELEEAMELGKQLVMTAEKPKSTSSVSDLEPEPSLATTTGDVDQGSTLRHRGASPPVATPARPADVPAHTPSHLLNSLLIFLVLLLMCALLFRRFYLTHEHRFASHADPTAAAASARDSSEG